MASYRIPPEILQFRKAVAPLKLIYWGGLLTTISFNFWLIGNESIRIELLPDFIGLFVLIPGLTRLTKLPVDSRYETEMSLVLGLAYSWAIVSIWLTFRPHLTEATAYLLPWLGVVVAIGALLFCSAMVRLAKSAGATLSRKIWHQTHLPLAILCGVQLGLATLTLLVGSPARESSSTMGSVAFILSLGGFGAALVASYFVWKAHRTMKLEADFLAVSETVLEEGPAGSEVPLAFR